MKAVLVEYDDIDDINKRNSVPFDLGLSGRGCMFADREGELKEGVIRGSFLLGWPVFVIESNGSLFYTGAKRIIKINP